MFSPLLFAVVKRWHLVCGGQQDQIRSVVGLKLVRMEAVAEEMRVKISAILDNHLNSDIVAPYRKRCVF